MVAEQKGFRKNRACVENIHSVASVTGPRRAEAETMLSFKLHTNRSSQCVLEVHKLDMGWVLVSI